jgi:polar amino acid transport system substrate-binding protein
MRPLLLLFLVLLAVPVKAADSVLAPNGTLRAAYIGTNVAQARLDSATGTVSGVIADIARELGRRADVPVTITPLPTAAAVIEAVGSGAADIGFVARRTRSAPGSCFIRRPTCSCSRVRLVRADSPLHFVNELDRPSHVIGINTDDSVGVWLQQHLTAGYAPPLTTRCATRSNGSRTERWWASPAVGRGCPALREA